jgi:hypothetical protein
LFFGVLWGFGIGLLWRNKDKGDWAGKKRKRKGREGERRRRRDNFPINIHVLYVSYSCVVVG